MPSAAPVSMVTVQVSPVPITSLTAGGTSLMPSKETVRSSGATASTGFENCTVKPTLAALGAGVPSSTTLATAGAKRFAVCVAPAALAAIGLNHSSVALPSVSLTVRVRSPSVAPTRTSTVKLSPLPLTLVMAGASSVSPFSVSARSLASNAPTGSVRATSN